MFRGSRLTLAATATSGALLAVLAARHLFPVAHVAVVVCAAVATPIALATGVQRIVYLWRGPPVVTFSPLESVRCGAADAGAIRAAAKLRGTLGGAGHLYPPRLVVHALACLAVAVVGGTVLLVPRAEAGWWLALVAGTGAVAVLLPARPFYYREAMDGEVAVSPPTACATLATRPGRGNSPTPIPTARNAADPRVAQEH